MDVSSSTATGPLSRDEVDAGTTGEGSQLRPLLLHTASLLPVLAECWAGLKDACLTLLSYASPSSLWKVMRLHKYLRTGRMSKNLSIYPS